MNRPFHSAAPTEPCPVVQASHLPAKASSAWLRTARYSVQKRVLPRRCPHPIHHHYSVVKDHRTVGDCPCVLRAADSNRSFPDVLPPQHSAIHPRTRKNKKPLGFTRGVPFGPVPAFAALARKRLEPLGRRADFVRPDFGVGLLLCPVPHHAHRLLLRIFLLQTHPYYTTKPSRSATHIFNFLSTTSS